jgi:VRR-NUC domain
MNAAFIPDDALRAWRRSIKKQRRYPESDLATALCRWFDYASAGFGIDKRLFFHCKNESKQSARAGARMKAQAVRKGCADYLLLVPRGQYHGLALELKAPGKKASPEQKEWLALVSGQGYFTAVCDSLPTAMACIQCYLTL